MTYAPAIRVGSGPHGSFASIDPPAEIPEAPEYLRDEWREQATRELATAENILEFIDNETFWADLVLTMYEQSEYLRSEFAKAKAESIEERMGELETQAWENRDNEED